MPSRHGFLVPFPLKQLFTHAFNVMAVQQTFTVRWDQALGTHRPSAAYAPRMQRIRLPSAEVMRSRIAAYGPRFSSGHSMVEFYA